MAKASANTLPSYIWIHLLLLLFCIYNGVGNFYNGGGDEGRVWFDLNMPLTDEFEEAEDEEVIIFESDDEYEGRVLFDLNMPSTDEFEEAEDEEVIIFESDDEYEGRVWFDLNMPSTDEFEEAEDEEVIIFESDDEYELEISIGIINGEEGEEDDYIDTHNITFPMLDLNQLPPPDEDE